VAKVSVRGLEGERAAFAPGLRKGEARDPELLGEVESAVHILGQIAIFGWIASSGTSLSCAARDVGSGRALGKFSLLEFEADASRGEAGRGGRNSFVGLLAPEADAEKAARIELRLSLRGTTVFEDVLAVEKLGPHDLKGHSRLDLLQRCLKRARPELAEIVAEQVQVQPLNAMGPFHLENSARCGGGIIATGWIANLTQRRIFVVDDALRDMVTLSEMALRARPDVTEYFAREGMPAGPNDGHGFTFVLPESPCAGRSFYFVEHDATTGTSTFYGPVEKPKGENPGLAADLAVDPFGSVFATPAAIGERLYRPLITRERKAATATKLEFGKRAAEGAGPIYSIIIPFYGDAFFLSCVYHLQRLLDSRYEVIIVVDDPKLYPAIASRLEHRRASIEIPTVLLRNQANYGYAQANNLGANAAAGEVLILMNSDILVENIDVVSRAADDVLKVSQSGQDVIAGFKLLYEDGTIQHVGMSFAANDTLGGLYISEHKMKGLPASLDSGPRIRSVPAVTGAQMAVSADLYRRLGGLDPAFERGDFEDADLCMRARQLGAEILLYAEPGIYHLERQSFSHLGGEKFRQMVTYLNCLEFNRRWGVELGDNPKVTKRKRTPGRQAASDGNRAAAEMEERAAP
jgi:GT2 family glycosyltransferase